MAWAMAWPCAGPKSRVRRISMSSVPCSSSTRLNSLWVDILAETNAAWVECQGESRGTARGGDTGRQSYNQGIPDAAPCSISLAYLAMHCGAVLRSGGSGPNAWHKRHERQ